MVHLKNPVSIKKYFGSVCEKYWLPSTNCQKQNKLPRSKKHGIGMGIKYFRHQEQGIKPQEIIKQNRMVDKQRASSISSENNLKPTDVLWNQDTNSSCCIVRTSTISCTTFSIT
ncbi:MAG: hypothetical protein HOG45_01620 [Deltaproteobacteria bacterium]|jgi:hypothetical protein|nr:hypothetical protein [Deltaproteobacteria bacterium]MBT5835501.1 hypothetical protein [Deltaproteobacteria bacterium]